MLDMKVVNPSHLRVLGLENPLSLALKALGMLLMALLSYQSVFAQGFGLPSTESAPLQCSLKGSKSASDAMLKASGNAIQQSFNCRRGSDVFEVGFLNVSLNHMGVTSSSGKKVSPDFQIKCTMATPMGAYSYGGYPTGFETHSQSKTPYFVKMKSGGRCFLQGNNDLLGGVQATINESAMVILLAAVMPSAQ
jgi:hypothetical protein